MDQPGCSQFPIRDALLEHDLVPHRLLEEVCIKYVLRHGRVAGLQLG